MAWDTMDGMRDLLRTSLGRSLRALCPLDRLQAAWPVACGAALAGHGQLCTFEDGVLTIVVPDPVWRRQLLSMESRLLKDLHRIAAVPVTAIHFKESEASRLPQRSTPPPAASSAARQSSSPAGSRPRFPRRST